MCMLQISSQILIFMSYVPGDSLEKVWPSLDRCRKQALSAELENAFTLLRSLQVPKGQPRGGIGGEGCKDHRRHVRESSLPIFNAKEFEDFLFSAPKYGGAAFITFLRQLYALPNSVAAQDSCVFTHGDLRPDNIIVRRNQDGEFTLAGIVDWEHSGFFPTYWEAVKLISYMSPSKNSDWYLHLPPSISPLTYPIKWLVDRVWDDHDVSLSHNQAQR